MPVLGYVPSGESGGDPSHNTNEEDLKFPELDKGYYEVEDIIERCLCKTTLTYEYRVRFKGYAPEDDMWLPSSSFNRSIHFETTSKYGPKRRHKLEPDENVDQPLCAKHKTDSAPSDIQGQRRNEEQGSVKKCRRSSSEKV